MNQSVDNALGGFEEVTEETTIRGALVRCKKAIGRFADGYAEGDPAVKKSLWGEVLAAEDNARVVLACSTRPVTVQILAKIDTQYIVPMSDGTIELHNPAGPAFKFSLDQASGFGMALMETALKLKEARKKGGNDAEA